MQDIPYPSPRPDEGSSYVRRDAGHVMSFRRDSERAERVGERQDQAPVDGLEGEKLLLSILAG